MKFPSCGTVNSWLLSQDHRPIPCLDSLLLLYSLHILGSSLEHSYFTVICPVSRVSLVAQLVKNPPTIRETWVPSLGWEDLLENGKVTHSKQCSPVELSTVIETFVFWVI